MERREEKYESRSRATTFAARAGRDRRRAESARAPRQDTSPSSSALDAVSRTPRRERRARAAASIALEDLDAEVTKFESEIDAVRQREDRDRSMLDCGSVNAKQLAELQHELETLQRRQSSLEDSLLEIMERREELQNDQADELSRIDELETELSAAARRATRRSRDRPGAAPTRSRRGELASLVLDADLVALYERQRAAAVPAPAGCRVAGAVPAGSRSTAARWRGSPPRADDDVLRCPECGAILLRSRTPASEGDRRGRRRVAGQSRARRVRRGGVRGRPRAVLAERKEAIGHATNNVAEYRGLIAGLEAAAALGATEVDVSMDSKLVVEQMSGRWRVKHPDLSR